MILFPDGEPFELGACVELILSGMAAVNASPSMLGPSQWEGEIPLPPSQGNYPISLGNPRLDSDSGTKCVT